MPPAPHPARHWVQRPDGRLECRLCPHHCKLDPGGRGLCFVRRREGEALVLDTYGRSSGFCVDPVEKKPLNHFLPGSAVLSFGTAGCNLFCHFCQNWEMSKARETDLLAQTASPEQIARAAADLGCASVAFTYNDPVIFLEYAVDVAAACRERGIRTVAVTAGYIEPEPRCEFFAAMDAANVDLKSFDPDFYRRLAGARLEPVLDTLKFIREESDCWLELTTLLIPGANDGDEELAALSDWVHRQLGADTPLHFTAFHPDFRLQNRLPTPPATLTRARRIAQDAGLRHVYTGNVHDPEGGSTWCPDCGALLIERDWYRLGTWGLNAEGACTECGHRLVGRFAAEPGHWGARRKPVDLSRWAEGESG